MYDDVATLRTLQAIQVLNDSLDRMHSNLTRAMGMHTSDLRALRMLAIREQQGSTVTPHALAAHLGITTAAATSLVDRLVAQGYAQRQRHPHDGRSRIVILTPRARQHFFQHFGGHLQAMRELMEPMDTPTLHSIAEFLEALAARVVDPSGTAPALHERDSP
ncbi:MarR family winged helix-turn-helix transcriptional regulator [Nesterenkonia flava]|uniref:MarR family transcriptional regulator n=1 Tax=Nesterenkonia flava TaxID=469799 RepID=A0ABU1FUJ4_9MICC|nr:MarR family transcriptional regulator [Nesterenkonia flava]MDR5712340.1 MarR family transcriptional regulator [Nesterenkonia flava]